jgi:hypothetical protein
MTGIKVNSSWVFIIRFETEQLLERLDQAILDLINNPKKTQKTACIRTLL